jgi:hypothetical protein
MICVSIAMLMAIGTNCIAQVQNDVSDGQVSVKSPDGTIKMTIRCNGPLTYSVSVNDRAVLAESRLGLKFKDGLTIGANTRLTKIERSSTDTRWENRFGKRRTVRNCHNELRAFFVEQSGRPFEIVIRAFDDGIGFRYVLFDAGWSSRNSILQGSQSVDMDELLAFAKERNVRLWLWLYWSSLERNEVYREAFTQYEKWGIAGVKIDFMNRDDQEMVNWYEKITKAAAEHHLMVNFHGAFKPTGMNRTYPNQITREGILGNEYNRWSSRVMPEHKVTLAFTRMLLGPADFTPGGFLNKQLDQFKFNVRPSQVQGTRCAELALFVCLESPIINSADHPSHYRNQPGLDFLKIVPTVWDDTRAIDAAVGEHIAVEQRVVTAAGELTLHLARAGGAVACFEPASSESTN